MQDYDLNSLPLPKLYGNSLRLFAGILRTGLGRSLLINSLLKSGGVLKLRQASFNEMPTFYPLPPRQTEEFMTEDPPLNEEKPAEPLPAKPYLTIRDFAESYRSGKTTPLEVAHQFLAAVEASERLDPPLRAFIAVDREDILTQAKASAERFARGEALGILDGVPVAIKDEIDQLPYPTYVGTTFLGNRLPKRDATVVERLRRSGALLLGKANMHEIGINPDGTNIHYGRACNPWDPRRDTGGSSSGPAAAVAAGFCPLAIGADGGGSIRIPSSHCGVVGLKPTFGRVSEAGAAPLCWSVAHIGPIGSSVEDVLVGYQVIGGPDIHDPHTLTQPPLTLAGWNETDLNGLRLGVYWDWFRHAEPEVVSVNESMLLNLQAAGAEVVEVTIPGLDLMRIAQAVTILSEMAASMRDGCRDWKAFAPSTQISLILGGSMTADDYLRAQRMRTRAIQVFEDIFTAVDAVITPATALAAPLIPNAAEKCGMSDLSLTTELMRFAFPANLTGHPAIVFPAGYTAAGLPVGMQAIGRYWQERVLFKIAHTAEANLRRRRPAIYYPLIA